jgi:hypothetical protein
MVFQMLALACIVDALPTTIYIENVYMYIGVCIYTSIYTHVPSQCISMFIALNFSGLGKEGGKEIDEGREDGRKEEKTVEEGRTSKEKGRTSKEKEGRRRKRKDVEGRKEGREGRSEG